MTAVADPPTTQQGAGRALTLATAALAVNFWAWNLLGPLAPDYQELLSLTPLQVSLLVTVGVGATLSFLQAAALAWLEPPTHDRRRDRHR